MSLNNNKTWSIPYNLFGIRDLIIYALSLDGRKMYSNEKWPIFVAFVRMSFHVCTSVSIISFKVFCENLSIYCFAGRQFQNTHDTAECSMNSKRPIDFLNISCELCLLEFRFLSEVHE